MISKTDGHLSSFCYLPISVTGSICRPSDLNSPLIPLVVVQQALYVEAGLLQEPHSHNTGGSILIIAAGMLKNNECSVNITRVIFFDIRSRKNTK